MTDIMEEDGGLEGVGGFWSKGARTVEERRRRGGRGGRGDQKGKGGLSVLVLVRSISIRISSHKSKRSQETW